MNTRRYRAERWIRRSIEDLDNYRKVFTDRVVRAFENINAEAEEVRDEAYARACANSNPEWDDEAPICEWAEDQGADFWITVKDVQQGVINLMVAGLYHLLEQQADRLMDDNGLPQPKAPASHKYHFERLKEQLKELKVDITRFASWSAVDELALVANTVKHGEGPSKEKLRKLNPCLFAVQYPSGHRGVPRAIRSLPLAGQGLYLTEDDFSRYHSALVQFWGELAEALVPVCCPGQSPAA